MSVSFTILSGVLIAWWMQGGNLHLPWADGWKVLAMTGMVLMVYMLIYAFICWYISGEAYNGNFTLLMFTFIFGILIFLVGENIGMVVGWELISLISFLLIGFWLRSEAGSSAISAVMYNRIGDFCLMAMLINVNLIWVLVALAVMGNSALWLWSYWLPMAMEGPTPVSSLLHSSTIVVAGVTFAICWYDIGTVIAIVGISIMSLFLPNWYDGNKIIAFSTAVHLCVICLAVSVGIYGLVTMHIITHGFVKATAFVSSSVNIGGTGTQDIRNWGIDVEVILISLAFTALCSISGSMVMLSKEDVVFVGMMMFVIVIGWQYTKVFYAQVTGVNSVSTVIIISGVIIFILGSSGFVGVETASLTLYIIGVGVLVNSIASYVLNN